MNLPTRHSTLLALDTSGPACSVALLAGGNTLQTYELEAQKHTREILPLLDKLLQKGGIDKNAVDIKLFWLDFVFDLKWQVSVA